MRRKFYAAMANMPAARELLEMIVELYIVEREAATRGVLGTDEHAAMRQTRSAEILGRTTGGSTSKTGGIRQRARSLVP